MQITPLAILALNFIINIINMWLFPGMFGNNAPVPELSADGSKIKTWVLFLLIAQTLISISQLILFDIMTGVMGLLTAMILFWGMNQNSFWLMMFYNIMVFFTSIQIFAELGIYAQDKINGRSYDSSLNYHHYNSTFFLCYLIFVFLFNIQ